jgi:hypothetical protein
MKNSSTWRTPAPSSAELGPSRRLTLAATCPAGRTPTWTSTSSPGEHGRDVPLPPEPERQIHVSCAAKATTKAAPCDATRRRGSGRSSHPAPGSTRPRRPRPAHPGPAARRCHRDCPAHRDVAIAGLVHHRPGKPHCGDRAAGRTRRLAIRDQGHATSGQAWTSIGRVSVCACRPYSRCRREPPGASSGRLPRDPPNVRQWRAW